MKKTSSILEKEREADNICYEQNILKRIDKREKLSKTLLCISITENPTDQINKNISAPAKMLQNYEQDVDPNNSI